MRQISKVVEIPATATIAQMETALNNHLNAGWVLIAILPLGTKTYAVLVRAISL